MRYVVTFSVALGAVLLYLLFAASANTASFAQSYPLLLGLNVALALCLMLLIGYQLWVLRGKVKAGIFGSKLTLRLLLWFGLMALLPGAVVYGVSVQFMSKSIESWFDVRVDKALEGGLSLGQSALDSLLRDLNKKADSIAIALAEQPSSVHIALLNKLREQAGVNEATLFTQRGGIIAFSSNSNSGLLPDKPSSSVLRQVRQQQTVSKIDSLPDKGLFLRVVVPVNVLSLSEDIRVLQLLQPVPPDLATNAEAVQSAYRDYQELSLARQGLKRLYGLTLTLTLLLALLSAISLAFLLSERLSAPLGLLAESTRAIAKGDFSQMHPVESRDELGVLMRSFNTMTRQLSEARATAELNQQQVEAAKAYLESILANLTSGVVAFDERFYVRTVNLTASQILGENLTGLRGIKLVEWGRNDPALQAFAIEVAEQFEHSDAKEWQKQIEYAGKIGAQVLLVRGTRLPAGIDNGYVLVFDDVTHLISAQRDAAWGEVARRLAHEIKNPLTPIQLSAERIEHKFADKLAEADAIVLRRSTQTIVNQVAAMKSMVDGFAEYARAPAANMRNLDLNGLVHEVLALYEPLDSQIKLELTAGLPKIRGDTTLLRQVVHNLLQNAQDALVEVPGAQIMVRTEVAADGVRLSVSDNGPGFPEHLMARLFEPYATTKQKGTGLGLAIVKKIVEEHHGVIQVENLKPNGASVSIVFPLLQQVPVAIDLAPNASREEAA
jgi:nitrogen fixation/metabolism regulation signal transduction histidine kinase